jgi:hypothetical protein
MRAKSSTVGKGIRESSSYSKIGEGFQSLGLPINRLTDEGTSPGFGGWVRTGAVERVKLCSHPK